VLARVEDALRSSGSDSPEAEAMWIIQAATKHDRAQLLLDPSITAEAERACESLAARRAAGEPLQYVTQVAGFRRLELAVGPGVFIPRPETELVAERAMQLLPQRGRLVDIGTGSGAIALAVADERPDAEVFATEASRRAFEWAVRNRDGLAKDVDIILCDLFDGLPRHLEGSFDMVVSNPPYIDRNDSPNLPPEVREYEPSSALFAGERGLDMIIRLADAALRWLKPLGWLVLEIGSDQAQSVRTLLGAAGYEDIVVTSDLAGHDRIAEASKP
jgi:release factor glutamine methyltransferase